MLKYFLGYIKLLKINTSLVKTFLSFLFNINIAIRFVKRSNMLDLQLNIYLVSKITIKFIIKAN